MKLLRERKAELAAHRQSVYRQVADSLEGLFFIPENVKAGKNRVDLKDGRGMSSL